MSTAETQGQTPATLRVAVVDDDPIVLEALSPLLDAQPDISVVATAVNGAEAVDLVHTRTIDVVLMDVQMPVLDGVAATSRVLQASRRTRVLLLTTFDEDTFLDGGIAAGASGFLLKSTPPAKIAEAVRAVAAGGKVLSPGPTSRVLERYRRGRSPQAQSAADLSLSDREEEVLRLLCQARSNQQIARQLSLAETTVKTHVSAIMRKMGVASRLEVVVEAFRRGLSG